MQLAQSKLDVDQVPVGRQHSQVAYRSEDALCSIQGIL